ncbi:MAG: D-aminoacyl-tRNA deacylase [Cardiobacteriaceae bacterium]|nr:D-aminoacyl-tRNA deacylase [Cardiobacteriaceae bacterium]
MIALIQRVNEASVTVDNIEIASIKQGLLAFIGIEKNDTADNATRLQQKLLNYRIFSDDEGRMNLNVCETNGEILLVSQFTLTANTTKGNRPGFDPAMPSAAAETVFARFCAAMQQHYPRVQCGIFGANMQVRLTNDGPVTFWLQT